MAGTGADFSMQIAKSGLFNMLFIIAQIVIFLDAPDLRNNRLIAKQAYQHINCL
jgi:hypothetical protein